MRFTAEGDGADAMVTNTTDSGPVGVAAAGRRVSARAVCGALRDDIVAHTFPPGSRLTEDLLARRYGVSRVPVREALRTLESEGFVVIRRHAGACVAALSEQEAADLLQVSVLLEPLGAARAAQRRTEAHLKVLRGLVRLGRQRLARGQTSDLRALGDWFHQTLAQASGSPSLAALLVQVRRKIVWLYAEPARVPSAGQGAGGVVGLARRDGAGVGRVAARGGGDTAYREAAVSWEEHGAIVDAVARGDAERARGLAAVHAERVSTWHRSRRPATVNSVKHGVNTGRERL